MADEGDPLTLRTEAKLVQELVQSDFRVEVELKDTYKVLRFLPFGYVCHIARGDLVNIGDLQYEFSGDGPFTYRYTFDNSDVATIVLGDGTNIDVDADVKLRLELRSISDTMPAGWGGSNGAWHAMKDPARSKTAEYTLTSPKAPGLMPMFFRSDVDGLSARINGREPERPPIPEAPVSTVTIPRRYRTNVQMAVAQESGIFGNSLVRWVIGPVFASGATRDAVMARVKAWVESYGVEFLAPLLSGAALSDLQPSTQLERDIVECLGRAFAGNG